MGLARLFRRAPKLAGPKTFAPSPTKPTPTAPAKPMTNNAPTEEYIPGKTTETIPRSAGCAEGHADTMEHIKRKWPQLYAFLTQGKPVNVKTSAVNPLMSRYMNPDGTVKFQDLVAAPDTELQAGVKTLTPAQKAALRARLASFQPSFAQRLGASAMGIDIEGQRARFGKLLA